MSGAFGLSGLILLTGSLVVAFIRSLQGRSSRRWLALAAGGLLLVLIGLATRQS